jgi:predicted O-methyltransferase YrrM
MWGDRMQWLPWGRLLDSVRTGKPAFAQVFGTGLYEYLTNYSDDAAMFRAAMAAHQSHNQIAAAYDLSTAELIIDIGGGIGRLIAALLRANPGAKGILLDRPSVISAAGEVLRQAGVEDRCRVIGGDFFKDMPAGGDAYVLSNVIMDQKDSDAIALLRASRSAMAANGRVVIIERVIPADNAPSLAQLSDLMSLVVTGGRIRSESEFDQLFDSAGLRRRSSIPLRSGYTVQELRPVEAPSQC